MRTGGYVEALRGFQRGYFVNLLRWHKGNMKLVARDCGMRRDYLYSLFKVLGLKCKDFRV